MRETKNVIPLLTSEKMNRRIPMEKRRIRQPQMVLV
jgi:hypothetical protein